MSDAPRRRGRPTGWRMVPPPELAERVGRARRAIVVRGDRVTRRAIAAELGVCDRTLRRYLRERPISLA